MEQNKYQGKKYPTNYFLEVYTMCSFKRVIQVYNYLSFFSNLSTSNRIRCTLRILIYTSNTFHLEICNILIHSI